MPEPTTGREPVMPDIDRDALVSAGLIFVQSSVPTSAQRFEDALWAYLYATANAEQTPAGVM